MSQQLRNSIITTFFGVLGLLIHFAQQSILARLIEPQEYAIFLSLGYLSFLSVIFNCLMPLLVVKRMTVVADNHFEASTYFSIYSKILNLISAVCFGFLVLTLPWVQTFLRISIPTGIFITYIYLIAIIYFAFYTAVLQSFEKFKFIAIVQLLQAVIRLACIVLPALFVHSNHQIASAGLLVSVVITNLILVYYARIHLNLKKIAIKFNEIGSKLASLKADVKYAVYTSIMYSFIILYNSFDIPMSRYLFSETQNVAFAPLTSLSKLCFSVPAMIIGVYFPTFIQSHHLRKNGYKELFHALGLTLALAAGIILVLNFDKELLVGLVFGKRYSGAEETLIYTCLSMTCLSLVNVLAHYYIAFEKFSVLAILFIFLAGQGVAAVAFPDIQMLQYVQNELYIFIGLLIALVIGLKFSSQQGLKVNVEIAPN